VYSYIHIIDSPSLIPIEKHTMKGDTCSKDSIGESFNKKKNKRSFLLTSNDDRSRLSPLKGSGLCMGLFLVPDYPILAATEGRFCQKRRSICRNLLFTLLFSLASAGEFLCPVSTLNNRVYIYTRCSFLLLHITLTT